VQVRFIIHVGPIRNENFGLCSACSTQTLWQSDNRTLGESSWGEHETREADAPASARLLPFAFNGHSMEGRGAVKREATPRKLRAPVPPPRFPPGKKANGRSSKAKPAAPQVAAKVKPRLLRTLTSCR